MGLPLLIPITAIYVLIFLTGVAGNVDVCLVIVKNKSMHTATNYYLFSLAVSDLMILVLGRTIGHWRFQHIIGVVLWNYIQAQSLSFWVIV